MNFMVDAFAVDMVVYSANQLVCFSLLCQKVLLNDTSIFQTSTIQPLKYQ